MVRALRRPTLAMVALALLGGSPLVPEHGPSSTCAKRTEPLLHDHGIATPSPWHGAQVSAPDEPCPHCTLCEFVAPCAGMMSFAVTDGSSRPVLPIATTASANQSAAVASDRGPPPAPPPKPPV